MVTKRHTISSLGMPVIGQCEPKCYGSNVYLELRVYDHVPLVDPVAFGLAADWPRFDLSQYYRTSGDGVKKLEYAIKVFKQQAERAVSVGEGAYLDVVLGTLEKVEQLRELLLVFRGNSIHLETTPIEGKLTCRATDPRPADRKVKKIAQSLKGGTEKATG